MSVGYNYRCYYCVMEGSFFLEKKKKKRPATANSRGLWSPGISQVLVIARRPCLLRGHQLGKVDSEPGNWIALMQKAALLCSVTETPEWRCSSALEQTHYLSRTPCSSSCFSFYISTTFITFVTPVVGFFFPHKQVSDTSWVFYNLTWFWHYLPRVSIWSR